MGLKWGRRTVGIVGLGSAAVFTVATILSSNQYVGLVFLALSYAGSDFMLPTAWAVCLDVGKKYAGAVTGTMNTAGQIGSFISSVLFGYFVGYANDWLPAMGMPLESGLRNFRYDLPLAPMTVMLAVSAVLWLKIDPTEQLIGEEEKAGRMGK